VSARNVYARGPRTDVSARGPRTDVSARDPSPRRRPWSNTHVRPWSPVGADRCVRPWSVPPSSPAVQHTCPPVVPGRGGPMCPPATCTPVVRGPMCPPVVRGPMCPPVVRPPVVARGPTHMPARGPSARRPGYRHPKPRVRHHPARRYSLHHPYASGGHIGPPLRVTYNYIFNNPSMSFCQLTGLSMIYFRIAFKARSL